MARNIEIKAHLLQKNKVLETLKTLTSDKGKVMKQYDTFYNVPNGRLKLRHIEGVRSELIFYSRPDTEGPKLSNYEKYDTDEDSNLPSVLEKALGVKGIIKKERILYLVGQTRVHIDSVVDLGNFIELEVVLKDDQSPEDGQRIAEDLMSKLGISASDLISGAYMDLIQQK